MLILRRHSTIHAVSDKFTYIGTQYYDLNELIIKDNFIFILLLKRIFKLFVFFHSCSKFMNLCVFIYVCIYVWWYMWCFNVVVLCSCGALILWYFHFVEFS